MSAHRVVVSVLAGALALFVLAAPAGAQEYRCSGERIEKGSSTWGHARSAGSDLRIEKGSNSIAWVRRAGSDWRIETFAGNTIGWLKSGRIEKPNGSTWTSLSDATLLFGCPDPVAAALWILKQNGKL